MIRLNSLWLLWSLSPFGIVLGGCSSLDNCPDAQDPITIEARPESTDAANFFYESRPSNGPLDKFPAKTELRFAHGFGVTPLDAHVELSFTESGTNNEKGGSIAESAGNQSLIECMDSKVIVVKNDTCERSFFIRVTAWGKAPTDLGSVCGE